MAELIYLRKFAAGEEIFRLGDRGRNAYIIERGEVAVSVKRDGEDAIIAKLGKGEIFGEMSMIDDAPRSATVTAIDDVELLVMQRSRFQKPLTSADPLMNLLLRVLLSRFRDAQRQLTDMRTEFGEIDPSLEKVRVLALNRIKLESEMRQGFADEEFELHYQPIVNLEHGHIVGFEALMRWRKNNGDFVPPVQFIPLAEDNGLIAELGRWALQIGLRDQLRFASRFSSVFPELPPPFMSVNVSAVQLSELTEIDLLATIIKQSGVNPSDVTLEMTESLLVENPAHAVEALNKIKELGVSIAIDDFGTGYSSLSYLHQYPLDTLKIDRAFVSNMDKSDSSRQIVKSVAHLALALDMCIVAEGIENKTQFKTLQEMGCHRGQGYYMAKPTTADNIVEMIESRPIW